MNSGNPLYAVETLRAAVDFFNSCDEHFNEKFHSAEDMIKFYTWWVSHPEIEFEDSPYSVITSSDT